MDKRKAGGMIRMARIMKGLTQTELAKKLNVTQGAVGAWEIGYSFPNPRSMVKLCAVLDIRADELLKAG